MQTQIPFQYDDNNITNAIHDYLKEKGYDTGVVTVNYQHDWWDEWWDDKQIYIDWDDTNAETLPNGDIRINISCNTGSNNIYKDSDVFSVKELIDNCNNEESLIDFILTNVTYMLDGAYDSVVDNYEEE